MLAHKMAVVVLALGVFPAGNDSVFTMFNSSTIPPMNERKADRRTKTVIKFN